MSLKIPFFAAFGLLFVSGLFAQQNKNENFEQLFPYDFQKATRFLTNEKWMDDSIRKHQLNPKEVLAIIFPELIRYNSIQDKIETLTLETLYIQYGKDYANFSIGEFQIKPSFAEKAEIDFLKLYGEKKLREHFNIQSGDTTQSELNRAKRLKRMKGQAGMVNYLCLFWKIMTAKYPAWKNKEEQIKFLASAYNCGYWKPKKKIEAYESKNFFHTGLVITSTKYCYADIAWYFYQLP